MSRRKEKILMTIFYICFFSLALVIMALIK